MIAGTATVDLSLFQRLRGETFRAAQGVCQRAARDGAKEGAEDARDRAPVGTYHGPSGSVTGGRLKSEITVQFDRAIPFGAQWEITAPTEYARYVEEGTNAHWIRPKAAFGSRGPLRAGQSRRKANDFGVGRGSFLRWYGPGGGIYFAREVWHPGTVAQPFMGPAGETARIFMIEEVHQGFALIAARWS